jgi:hypothetical protein
MTEEQNARMLDIGDEIIEVLRWVRDGREWKDPVAVRKADQASEILLAINHGV